MRGGLLRRLPAGLCAAALLVSTAWAQAPPPAQAESDPLESMPIRFGPVGLSPSLAITDFGVDTNVFNEAANTRSDFTMTISPRLVARLRGGPVLLTATNGTGFVYFHETDAERNVSYTSDVRADFAFDRLQPYIAASFLDTRERLNAELDIRAPRRNTSVVSGARLAIGASTAATVEVRRTNQAFDEQVSFEGVPLSLTMNDRTDVYDAGLLFALTPLTTLRVTSSWQRDRFENSPGRDANSFRFMPALQFDSAALIQGTVAIGYRRFEPLGPDLAGHQGLAVQTSLGYTLLERTRFEVRVTRDVHYSFEAEEPYYLDSGVRFDVMHQLVGPFDLRATLSRDSLEYRELGASATSRSDSARLVSAGVGYRLRDDTRIVVAWESAARRSVRPERNFDRHRLVASVTYGL
jgi:hypothetical protein